MLNSLTIVWWLLDMNRVARSLCSPSSHLQAHGDDARHDTLGLWVALYDTWSALTHDAEHARAAAAWRKRLEALGAK